jgi:hypothetical protein
VEKGYRVYYEFGYLPELIKKSSSNYLGCNIRYLADYVNDSEGTTFLSAKYEIAVYFLTAG